MRTTIHHPQMLPKKLVQDQPQKTTRRPYGGKGHRDETAAAVAARRQERERLVPKYLEGIKLIDAGMSINYFDRDLIQRAMREDA